MAEHVDMIIVGGGIAGMTAAIYAQRANLKTLILESNICGGLVNSTYVVENVPSHKAIHGMDLMEQVREQAEALGARIEEACTVTAYELHGNPKRLATDIGDFTASAVLLSTGRKPLPLLLDGPNGKEEADCEQVHYCAICDGAPYKGKRVLVVGGGNSGFDEALFLMNLGIKELTLVEVMPRFFAAQSAQEQLLARPGTRAMHSTKVKELHQENGTLCAVSLENVNTQSVEKIEVEGIFVFMGQSPNTEPFKDSITLDTQHYILTNDDMETNIPGVYGVGDVRQKKFRQITTAMSDGTIAALNAERYIRSLK